MNRRELIAASAAATLVPATAGVAATQAAVTVMNDLEYATGAGEKLQLNLALPAGEGPFPGVVCIHGGGFRAGTRQGYDGMIKKLAEAGFAAVTISYRLAPKHPFPAAVHDCKAAVRWMRANASKYRIRPDRIGTMGGSAGGTLAQMLGVTAGVARFEGDGGNPELSSAVTCVVNHYGANDFTHSYGKSVDAHEVLPLYLGADLVKARKNHILSSPLFWVNPDSCPTLCIHGTEDKYVAYEQSVWLVDRLLSCEVEAQLMTMPGAGHGFRGEDLARAEAATIAYFNRQLKA